MRLGRRRRPRSAFRYVAEDAPSGYGDAADRLVRALRASGVSLEYSAWSTMDPRDRTAHARPHSREWMSSAPARRDAPTVAHLVPEHLPNLRRAVRGPLISHTVWETDRLPDHWPALLDAVDRVVVPTEWNREVFIASGVTTPVVVVPHVVCDPVLGDLGDSLGFAPDTIVFYTIGRWDQRKVPSEVIRAYLEAFTAGDPVALVVKTSPYAQYPSGDRWGRDSAISGTTMLEVARIVREFPHPALVRVEVDDWDTGRIAGLHARGDCYVSLSHGEGWGLGAFDAAAYGNPVVMTGWGGQLEFLDRDVSFLVDYDLEPIRHWQPRSYSPHQHWAVPRREHAVELLREVAGDIDAARRRAAPLRPRVLDTFAPSRVAATLLDAVPELETAVETAARNRGPTRRRDEDLLLVGVVVGPWLSQYDNWVEMAERNGYRFELLGREIAEPFIPNATKWRVLLDFFADQPRERLVFHLDAADAFVTDRAAMTLSRYHSYQRPVVLGAVASSPRSTDRDDPAATWRRANSGCYVGEAGILADVLRGGYDLVDWEETGNVSDQRAMNAYLALPGNRDLATVDHRRLLVQNIRRAPRYDEYDQHRSILLLGARGSCTSSVHFYGDNGHGYNAFAELYDLAKVPLQPSGRLGAPRPVVRESPVRTVAGQPIPRIVHFVFGLRNEPEPFHLVHYLAIRSCIEKVRPDEVQLHCHHLPFGPWWDRVEADVRLRGTGPVPTVSEMAYTDPLVARYSYAHHADFVRLDVLAEHGGLYADLDTVFVAPVPDRLWRQQFVIGREGDVVDPSTGASRPALSNALMMSAPRSRFVEAWRAEIGGAFDGTWASHSCFLAHELAERMANEVHVEPQRTFHAFDSTPAGLSRLLEGNEMDLDGIVSIHLAAHLWWDDDRRDFSRVHAGMISEEWVRRAPVTYAITARQFLPER